MNILGYKRECNKLDALREYYFEVLEQNCVEFIEYEDIGNGYTVSRVKPEYAMASVDEMIDYLDMPEWVANWTRDVINSDLMSQKMGAAQ